MRSAAAGQSIDEPPRIGIKAMADTITSRTRIFGLLWLSVATLAGCAVNVNTDWPDVDYLNGSGALPTDPPLPFSEAVRIGDVLYLSGMIGVKPGTLELVPGGMAAEARQTMENIRTVLEAHGATLGDIVKCTVMLEDIAEWGAFNAVYVTYFRAPYPARSAFGTDGLAIGARVEVECMAVVGKGDTVARMETPMETILGVLARR